MQIKFLDLYKINMQYKDEIEKKIRRKVKITIDLKTIENLSIA